jgi:hypothetical protein
MLSLRGEKQYYTKNLLAIKDSSNKGKLNSSNIDATV